MSGLHNLFDQRVFDYYNFSAKNAQQLTIFRFDQQNIILAVEMWTLSLFFDDLANINVELKWWWYDDL